MAGEFRQQLVQKLIGSYTRFYDVAACDEAELPLAARCEYHQIQTSYVISKKAQLWEAAGNEYLYLFSLEKLTAESYARCYDQAYEEGMKLIDPKPGHMVSRISIVIVCDEADPDAVETLKACRTYKNFRFSLRGWMEVHTTLVLPSEEQVVTNRFGRKDGEWLKKVLFNH